jgi:hypothetical protein
VTPPHAAHSGDEVGRFSPAARRARARRGRAAVREELVEDLELLGVVPRAHARLAELRASVS